MPVPPRVAAALAILWGLPLAGGARLTVRSDFEAGSIGRVVYVGPRHLRCEVKGEVDQDKRNRQASWYYFEVRGAAGHEITIDLTGLLGEYNYRPGNLAINGATRPFISYDRETWTALPDTAVEWDEAALRLRLRFTPTRSRVWIAHLPPYTSRHLSKLLSAARSHPSAEVTEVGRSAGGRSLWLITVTSSRRPATDKKVLWIMARQHAWESGTSWVVDGAVRFLLGDDPLAARLRDRFIFKLFPMADPDGVARGGVRFNVHGYDLNRHWDAVDPKRMPEIAALRAAILDWVDRGSRVDLFLSLHNTNSDYLQGPLTAAGSAYRQLVERFADLLAKSTFFDGGAPRDWPPGEVAQGRMDVCRGLFHDRRIPTLLLELNVQRNRRLGRPPHVEDYRQFGERLVIAMARALEPE
jgi:hypothetical protein